MRIQTLLFPTLLPTLALTIAALVVTGPAPGIRAQTPGAGYYTESQARRGFTAFNRNCAFCHTVDSTTVAEQVKTGRGLRVGVAGRSLMNLGGKYLMKVSEGHPDYPSVYYIFNRIRQGMPAFGSDAIGIDTKLDIVAYILQANGLPAAGAACRAGPAALAGAAHTTPDRPAASATGAISPRIAAMHAPMKSARSYQPVVPIFSVISPCHLGASPVSMRRGACTTG